MSDPVPTKGERLAEIFRRMAEAPPCSSADDAYRLLCETIDAVEDEWTDTPNEPVNYKVDGRIYPPQDDRRYPVQGRSDLARYGSKGHNTFIRDNGAITIVLRNGVVVFNKSGADGQGTSQGE
jgi:hypothetical protein